MLLALSFLALAIASLIAWVELVTSKYPRTISLFWRTSRALLIYTIVYGGIAFGFMLGYDQLAKAKILQLQASPEATWLTAVMIGLSVKALLHIRLFSVPSTGSAETFPVGTETIVQIFEPWLLRTILIDESNAVSAYLDPRADLYPDFDGVKLRIKQNLPASLNEVEKKALTLDVEQAPSVRVAMEIYLRAFGVSTMDRVFPNPPVTHSMSSSAPDKKARHIGD